MTTHQAFRTLRRLLGLSQRFVAKSMGVSQAALCRWERTGDGIAEWRAHQARQRLIETARLWGRGA